LLVEVQNVSKRFTLREARADHLSAILTALFRDRKIAPRRNFWALRDISFGLDRGQSMGVIGTNGSGKSTLLKLINQTMRPTTGCVKVNGRRSALIELGAGFHMDFPGRDNAMLASMIMGMTQRQARERIDDILAFAELEQFAQTPIKYYSSGMQARLGFSVAVAVKPDLLIVDEVLAVGDARFVEKCRKRIREMQGDGVSVLLVSHNLDDVSSVCDNALWIEKGVVRAFGPSGEVIAQYQDFLSEAGS